MGQAGYKRAGLVLMAVLALAAGQARAQQAEAPAADAPYAQGNWTFQTYGSATLGDAAGEVYTGHIGAGYYIRDNLSLNGELVLGAIDTDDVRHAQGDGAAAAAGFDLLLRWHFLRRTDFSLYLDGGAGMMYSDQSIPADGTHFNFRPQLGAGFTWACQDDWRLMGGARWLHISNCDKSGDEENPGFDGAMIYAGLMKTF